MGFFRRRRGQDSTYPDDVSDAEENPELAAAEAAVRLLPGPPPSANPFFDVVLGARPRMVSFPNPAEETDDDKPTDS